MLGSYIQRFSNQPTLLAAQYLETSYRLDTVIQAADVFTFSEFLVEASLRGIALPPVFHDPALDGGQLTQRILELKNSV